MNPIVLRFRMGIYPFLTLNPNHLAELQPDTALYNARRER